MFSVNLGDVVPARKQKKTQNHNEALGNPETFGRIAL